MFDKIDKTKYEPQYPRGKGQFKAMSLPAPVEDDAGDYVEPGRPVIGIYSVRYVQSLDYVQHYVGDTLIDETTLVPVKASRRGASTSPRKRPPSER